MKNIWQTIKKNKFFVFAFIIFLITRIFILLNPPSEYSDVRHDYERYANMWWYGLPPYLKHLYEYGPATIPLLIIPLAIDLGGVGFYYLNYRWQIFLIEAIIYFFVIKALKKIFASSNQKYLSIILYNLSALIVKDFWYEGIDLAFIASLALALISYLLIKKQNFKSQILFWSLFWLSTAIKFITLPLVLPFLLIKKKKLKKELLFCFLGFLLIWGAPLLIFRSSLSVALIFHAKRPLHASSFPAFIIYTINHFSHSEKMINLEWFGPLSQKALFWSFIFLGINTFLVLFWSLKSFFNNLKSSKNNRYVLMLKTSLIYLIVFSLSGKIFSPPFNIWYVLLLTIFPYKNIKTQLIYFFLGIWGLIFNTTNLFNNIPYIMIIYPFTLNYLRHLLRFLPLLIIIFLTFNHKKHNLMES